MTDVHGSAVYAAEHRLERWIGIADPTVRVFGSDWQPEDEIKFADVESVQRYVDRVLTHVGLEPTVKVRERRGNTWAHYEPWSRTIAIPPLRIGGAWAMRETKVLHELAHHLTPGEHHSPRFCAAQVYLFEQTGHLVIASLLRIALCEEGITFDNWLSRTA